MALRRLGWLLLPLVLLQACSSTPFGRQLADSFDSPAAAPASAPAANGAGRPKPPSSPKTGAAAKTGQEDPAPTSAPIAEKPAAPLQSQPKPVPQSAAPQPYRIILRLSGTGTKGATLRLYLERYVATGGNLDQNPQQALAGMIAAADALAGIRSTTGMDVPTVIT